MKCYDHVRIDAVATCEDCRKGLCRECVDRYLKITICDACNQRRAALEKAESIKGLNRLSVTFTIGTFAGYQFILEKTPGEPNIVSYALGIGYLCVALLSGWRVLSSSASRLTMPMLISLPVWVASMALRALLAVCFGLFIFPYRVVRYVVTIKKVATLQKSYDIRKRQAHQSAHTPVDRLDSLIMDVNSYERTN